MNVQSASHQEAVASTPEHRERAPLSQMTPEAVQATQAGSAPQAGSRKLVGLQSFSLRSRRSAPYSTKSIVKPGAESLMSVGGIHDTLAPGPGPVRVQLCDCSWKQPLAPDAPRLCHKDTNDHYEYWLLNSMGARYAEERRADELPQEGPSSERAQFGTCSLADMAANNQVDVHFILKPEDVVVGYVAFLRSTAERPQQLYQLYVEPRLRRQAFATNALRVLLDCTREIQVLFPNDAVSSILAKLDFVIPGGLFADEAAEGSATTFRRSIPLDQNVG